MPDLQTVPRLPHPDNLVGSDIFPNVVRSLCPMVHQHFLLYELHIKFLSSDESTVILHEIVLERVDFVAETLSWVSANALLGDSEIIGNPHILFDVSDGGSLVVDPAIDIEDHLQPVVVPVIDEGACLSLVTMFLSGVRSREPSDASNVGLVSDHDFIMSLLSEHFVQQRVVLLHFHWQGTGHCHWSALGDLDVFFLI